MPGEVLKLSIQEALITMFTDDPINWLKWAVVFAVLIGGYAIAVPLYKKASHGMSWGAETGHRKEQGPRH